MNLRILNVLLVLVHGYLASPDSWEESGINAVLDSQGWKRGGIFKYSPVGPQLFEAESMDAKNTVYVVDLPSEAPVIVQSDLLLGMLKTIRQRQPDEPLIIVGHSAGGVVARMSLVRAGAENVVALITIASPHVGTTRAEQAIDVTKPISYFYDENNTEEVSETTGDVLPAVATGCIINTRADNVQITL